MKKSILAAIVAVGALLALPGGAFASDRDHDRMPDRWERAHQLKVGVKDGRRDPDRDGLTNRAEYRSQTDPRDGDTDDDCLSDAAEDRDDDGVDNESEIRDHTSPRHSDSDDDGIDDGDEDADDDGRSNASEDDNEADDDRADDCDDDDDHEGDDDHHGGDDSANDESGDDR